MLESVQLPMLWYIVIVIVSIIFIILFGLYIVSQYYFGKPMAPFFHTRIKRWADKNAALFEIIDITGNVSLIPATHETGGYRRTQKTKSTRTPFSRKQVILVAIGTFVFMGLIAAVSIYSGVAVLKGISLSFLAMVVPAVVYARQPIVLELIEGDRQQPLIMPKSVYSINTVPTIPLIDLHPELHPDIIKGLEKLVKGKISTLRGLPEHGEGKITTLEQLENKAKESPDEELIEGYTYQAFYELYLATKQKYEFEVKVSDVADAIQKNFDKNFRESIEGKEYNQKVKRSNDQKYAFIGYLALLLVVLGVMFKLVYVTIYGGGA